MAERCPNGHIVSTENDVQFTKKSQPNRTKSPPNGRTVANGYPLQVSDGTKCNLLELKLHDNQHAALHLREVKLS